MKKVLLIVVFLLLAVAIPITVFVVKQRQEIRQRAVPATVLYLDPTSLTRNIGDNFELAVKMDTNTNIIANAELHFNYNAQYLEGVNIRVADTLPNILVGGTVDNQTGKASITIGVYPSAGGVSGSGLTIAYLTFKALASTATPTDIRFDNTTQLAATNEPGDNPNVLDSAEGASITIAGTGTASPSPSTSPGGPTPTPRPTPTTTPGTTPRPSPSVRPTPSTTPTSQVTKITYPANGTTISDRRPAIYGMSFANTVLVLSITTSPVVSTSVNVDAQGNWTYPMTTDLANGTYTITITGDNGIIQQTATSTFTVSVSTGGTNIATPTPTPTPTATPSSGSGTTITPTATPQTATTKGGIPVTGTTIPTLFLISMAVLLLIFGSAAFIFVK